LNTVAHTVGAAEVGTQAKEVSEDTYFEIVSAILILFFVFPEIIPKTVGANNNKKLVNFIFLVIRGQYL